MAYCAYSPLSAGLSAQSSSSAPCKPASPWLLERSYGSTLLPLSSVSDNVQDQVLVNSSKYLVQVTLKPLFSRYLLKAECNFHISIYCKTVRPKQPDKFWQDPPAIHFGGPQMNVFDKGLIQ